MAIIEGCPLFRNSTIIIPRLTVHAWLMSDGRHHGFGVGEKMVHGISRIGEHYLIVVLRDDILLARHNRRVILMVKQLQQVVDS